MSKEPDVDDVDDVAVRVPLLAHHELLEQVEKKNDRKEKGGPRILRCPNAYNVKIGCLRQPANSKKQ